MIYIKDKYTVYIHAFISCSLLPDFFLTTPFGPFTLIYPTEGSKMTCLQDSSPL